MRDIAASTVFQVSERALTGGLGLVATVLVARHLSPDDFGKLSYASALVAIMGALCAFGLEGVIVRGLVSTPQRSSDLLSTALGLRITNGVLAWPLTLAIAWILDIQEPLLLATIAVVALAPSLQSAEVLEWYFQAKARPWGFLIPRMVSGALSAITRIGLVALGAPLLVFAWMIPFEWATRFLILARALRRSDEPPRLHFPTVVTARNLLGQSWPLALAGLSGIIYMRIDQVMIGSMLGSSEVGIYSAALTLSEVWYLIPVALGRAVAPALIRAHAEGRASYELAVGRIMRTAVVIHLLVGLSMTLLADRLVGFVFGANFVEASSVLQVHVWTALFVALGVISGICLINEGLQTFAMLRTFLGAIVNIALNFWLIPLHGPVGAAWATLISQLIAAWAADLLHPSTRSMFKLKLRALMLKLPSAPS